MVREENYLSNHSVNEDIDPHFKTYRIALIDRRALERECFVRGVEAAQPHTRVDAFSGVAEWLKCKADMPPMDAILFNVEGRRFTDKALASEVAELERAARPVAVIVLSPYDDITEMIAALDAGVRGYVSTSLGIAAALNAVPLATAGALCMPAKSVLAIRNSFSGGTTFEARNQFTPRQRAVADALRRGKPNKLIAYELNMCESTVKVHIRTIMKKLRASNRTEAGFKLTALLADSPDAAPGDGEAPAPDALDCAAADGGAAAERGSAPAALLVRRA